MDMFAVNSGDSDGNFLLDPRRYGPKNLVDSSGPTWNRGQHATLEVLQHLQPKFPFEMRAPHADNGEEILNHHVVVWLEQR